MGLAGVKAVILDLDGTLVYSPIDFAEMKRRVISILEENGVPEGILKPTLTNAAILELAESAWRDAAKPEAERAGVRVLVDEAMNEVEREALPRVRAVEGVVEAVRRLRAAGFRLGVLTRSHHAYAVEALRRTGLYGSFDVVLGREDTRRPKPYAEALLGAAALLGLGIGEVLYVGDHATDRVSAENAGCLFIGVRTGSGEAFTSGNRPQVVLESVRELPEYLAVGRRGCS